MTLPLIGANTYGTPLYHKSPAIHSQGRKDLGVRGTRAHRATRIAY